MYILYIYIHTHIYIYISIYIHNICNNDHMLEIRSQTFGTVVTKTDRGILLFPLQTSRSWKGCCHILSYTIPCYRKMISATVGKI